MRLPYRSYYWLKLKEGSAGSLHNEVLGRMVTFSNPLSGDDISRVIALHDVYRGYIKNEDSIINYRTTWLITLQTILVGVFGFTSQKYADILTVLINSSTFGTTLDMKEKAIDKMMMEQKTHLSYSMSLLKYIIDYTPIVGMLLCATFLVSIYAAYMSCYEVKNRAAAHSAVFTALSLPGITGGGGFSAPFLGSIASFFVPLGMSFFWLFAKFIITPRF